MTRRDDTVKGSGTDPVEAGPSRADTEAPAARKRKRKAGKSGPKAGPALTGMERYRVERELGRGAMGIVSLAVDLNLDHPVALKEFVLAQTPTQEKRAELVERFEREGEAAIKLDHPNVVRVQDAFSEGDRYFIVMEYLEGDTLDKVVARGPVPPEAAVGVIVQVLKALSEAHDRGIVHRDLKPENVFVLPDGGVKVGDFGIAHVEDGPNLTRAGEVLGTLGYMSPEQVRGEGVDGRSDIFAVGIILYEMLVGANPFHSDQPTTVMYRIAYEEPPDPTPFVPGLPEHLQAVLTKATAKDSGLRYQLAADMLADLESGTAPDVTAVVAASAARAAERKASSKAITTPGSAIRRFGWKPAVLIGVALVLAMSAAGGYAYVARQQREAEERRVAAIVAAKKLTKQIETLKHVQSDLASAIGGLRGKADANAAAVRKWDSDWRSSVAAYDKRAAVVSAHNLQEDQAQAASAYTVYGWYTGWVTYYRYTPDYLSVPNYPSPPRMLTVDLGAERTLLAAIESEATSLSVSVASPSGSTLFAVVYQRTGEAATAVSAAAKALEVIATDMIEYDEEKGDIADASQLARFDKAAVDAKVKAAEDELKLYLANYGVKPAELR